LDERLEPSQDPAIQGHAKSCEDCERDLQGYERLMTRGVQAVANQQRDNGRLTPTIWLTIAATFFIVVTFFPQSEQTQTASESTHVNSKGIASIVVEEMNPAAIELVQPLAKQHVISNSSYNHVVANGHFVQPLLSIGYMAQADWSGVPPVEMPFGVQVPAIETKWIQVVADEMVPIQRSVNSTLDLIARTLSTSA